MTSFDQFVGLSGLPRSGSTLLSAILCQNPKIHAEGNSALCQIMWDTLQSCKKCLREQLTANGRQGSIQDILGDLPHSYYKHNSTKEKIVVDKCRSWTIDSNFDMLKSYVDRNVKIIVLERPIIEVVSSFVRLFKDNKIHVPEKELNLLSPRTDPIMRSIMGINYAKKNNQKNNVLFISYDELVNNTESTINKIYEFCGWEPFKHNFDHVKVKYPENDQVYGMRGQHKIRKKVERRKYDAGLRKETIEKCKIIDNLMHYKSDFYKELGVEQ